MLNDKYIIIKNEKQKHGKNDDDFKKQSKCVCLTVFQELMLTISSD